MGRALVSERRDGIGARATLPRLIDPACRDVSVAGAKGASLARIAAAGLPVPAGFVVPADRLAAGLPDRGMELRKVLRDARDESTLRCVAGRARALIASAPPAGLLPWMIARANADLGEEPVAIRSSACREDGTGSAFLRVRGPETVMARVRDCWMAFFSEDALFHRARNGSLEDLDMAVVVQRMVEADVAGVLFTTDRSEGTLPELAGIGDELERALGGPQAVEWAMKDGELFVLGSTPVGT